MIFTNRRVVTGLNSEGKSCITSNQTLDQISACHGPRAVVWCTDEFPVSNKGIEEAARPFDITMLKHLSSMLILRRIEPGETLALHATDTIDYVIILSGTIELGLEDENIIVGPGDIVIDRGVMHSWRTIGDEPVIMLATLVQAEPVR